MYTTVPLQMINTLNDHSGFYVVLVSLALCNIGYGILTLVFDDNLSDSGFWGFLFTSLVVCVISGILSVSTGYIKTFENIPVHMKFVGFQAEGYNIEERSGKSTRRVDIHNTYVIYEDANSYKMLIPAEQNSVYPPVAVFYYNKP